jgi:hypothetical protein
VDLSDGLLFEEAVGPFSGILFDSIKQKPSKTHMGDHRRRIATKGYYHLFSLSLVQYGAGTWGLKVK